VDKITDLLIHLEYDSAIRKAFVILKSRLASRFNAPNNLDGTDLVNHIFGKSGSLSQHIKDNERQAMRDLLSGLYGVFRNRYGHEDIEPSWHETDAILSMINYVLKDIERFEGNVPVT
jgi:hypothetical protein